MTYYVFFVFQAYLTPLVLNSKSSDLADESPFYEFYYKFDLLAAIIGWSVLFFMTVTRIGIAVISFYKNQR